MAPGLVTFGGAAPSPPLFDGSLPTTAAELNGWTQASPWEVVHNFTDFVSGSPGTCAAVTGSTAFTLTRLGSGDPEHLTADQAGYADQGGIKVRSAQELLYKGADSNWSVNTTIPTCYLVVLQFDSAPSGGQDVFAGLSGVGSEGWVIHTDGSSGVRLTCMGTDSSYVSGSTDLFDGSPHALLVVVDDAAGKAKLLTEWGNVELTGLSYSETSPLLATIGPPSTGGAWTAPVRYFQSAKGKHALAYTRAQSLLDEYVDALTNNTAPSAIAGLPTTLADLSDATGETFAEGFNLSSATPASIGTGPTLGAYTGLMQGSVTGTAPTVRSAPQVRTSFTAQGAIGIDSSGDNLTGVAALPDGTFTLLAVVKPPSGGHPGSARRLAGRINNTSGSAYWALETVNANSYRFISYNNYNADARTVTLTKTNLAADNTWHVIAVTRRGPSAANRIKVDGETAVSATANSATAQGSITEQGGLGKTYQDTISNTPFVCDMAFVGWMSSSVTDANLDSLVDNFRWRYGI